MKVGVVGGGPVGILFSKLCLEFGFEVILIDAGGKTEESSHLSKKNYKFKSPSSIPEGVHKIGGGSNYWRARISEFQEDDFNHQDLSGHKLWPFSKSELQPYYKELYKLLGAGEMTDNELATNFFMPVQNKLLPEFNLRTFRFCDPSFFLKAFNEVENHKNLQLLLGHYCLEIRQDIESHKFYLELLPRNFIPRSIELDVVVLAGGAIQSTALIQRSPDLNGKPKVSGLGRYLMDHREGYVGTIIVKKQKELELFSKMKLNSQNRVSDMFHGIGLAFSLANPLLRNKINTHFEIRELMPKLYFSKFINITSKFVIVARFALFLERVSKFIARKLLEIFDKILKIKRYSLYMKAEELPNSESRIYVDKQNSNLTIYDHRISEKTNQLIIEQLSTLEETFRLKFNAKLRLYRKIRKRKFDQATFSPNWHPMGTTRLGNGSIPSVCDENLEINGVENCFVLSSSVFPSGSNSNPTFTTLALGLRLFNHIKYKNKLNS